MNDPYQQPSERWFQRIKKSRRTFFFQQIGKNSFTITQLFNWVWSDIIYTVKWGINILLQLRAYGIDIRVHYRCSIWTQMRRMIYLTFQIGIEPKYFRSYLLFQEERWNKVDRFAFDQYDVQYQLMNADSPEEKEILKNKFNIYKHCRNHSINTPEVVAVFDRGRQIYPTPGELMLPEFDLFIKDLYGKSGQGVKRCYYSDNHFIDEEKNHYSKREFLDYLIKYSREKRAVIVQKILKNHSSWLSFTSGALCTCRIVTARIPGKEQIKPLFCNFRMPVGPSIADNFALGGIASDVNLKIGVLKEGISSKPYAGKYLFDTHPDTGQPITGETLPHFDELIEYALEVHGTFKTKFIGWDLSLTETGWCLIEGNIGWGADIVESTSNTPLVDTQYPEIFESWMNKLSR